MPTRRSAFFISDRTGITAEMLGHSLLTQFEQIEFSETTLPFIDSAEKAQAAVEEINAAGMRDGARPLVFSTLVDPDISVVVARARALVLDCFQIFIAPMEAELGMRSSHAVGRSHSVADSSGYFRRIDAVNYALSYDDGQSTKELENADVILVGVSRSGNHVVGGPRKDDTQRGNLVKAAVSGIQRHRQRVATDFSLQLGCQVFDQS